MKSGELEKKIKSIIRDRKQLVVSGGLILTAILLVVFVIVPQFKSALNNWHKLATERKKLDKLRGKAVALDSALVSAEFAQSDAVEQALPSKKPLLELLAGLGNGLSVSGAKLDRLELSPGLITTASATLNKKPRKSTPTLDLEIDVVGSFAEVEAFMNYLEEMLPFTEISTFSLSENARVVDQETKQRGPSTVKASLQTRTYYFDQTVTQTLEKPLPTITDQERAVLKEIASFKPPELVIPNSVTGGGQEDLFGVEGYAQQLRQFYQLNKNLNAPPQDSSNQE